MEVIRNLLRHWATTALIVAIAVWISLPGSVFAQWQLKVLDDGEVVVQTRSSLIPRTFTATWYAEVQEIEGSTVCRSPRSGIVSVYGADQRPYRAPVAEWVGDPACELELGKTYVLEATWRFTVLGVERTSSATSEPFKVQR